MNRKEEIHMDESKKTNNKQKLLICLLSYIILCMTQGIYSIKLTGSWSGINDLFGVPNYTSVSVFIVVCNFAEILLLVNAIVSAFKWLIPDNKLKATVINQISKSGTLHAVFSPFHGDMFGEDIHDITFLFDTNDGKTLTLLNADIDHENKKIHITTFDNKNGTTEKIQTVIDIAPQTADPKESEDDVK